MKNGLLFLLIGLAALLGRYSARAYSHLRQVEAEASALRAQQDAKAAAEKKAQGDFALKLAKGETGSRAFADFLRSSPAKAFRLWKEQQGVSGLAVESFAQEWAKQDAKAALLAGLSLDPLEGKADFVKSAFEQWLEKDADAALSWLSAHLEEMTPFISSDTLSQKKLSGKNLLLWMQHFDAEEMSLWQWSEVLYDNLRSRHGPSILALAEQVKDPAWKDLTLFGLGVAQLRMNRADDGKAYLAQIHSPVLQESARSALLSHFTLVDLPRALQQMRAIADAEERERMESIMMSSLEHARPQLLGQLLQDFGASISPEAREDAFDTWFKLAPLTAMKWAMSLPDEKQRESLMSEVGSDWMQTAPSQFFAYLASLSPSPERDALASDVGLLINTNTPDPATATRSLAFVSDPELRSSKLLDVYERWLSLSPQAALAWLALPQSQSLLGTEALAKAKAMRPNQNGVRTDDYFVPGGSPTGSVAY